MKVIVAGSRNIDSRIAFYEFLAALDGFESFGTSIFFDDSNSISTLVTGMCPTGPDQVPFLFVQWNNKLNRGPFIKIKEFPANWEKYGRAAGPIRNKEMAEYADALILIWDGKSKGSLNMLKNAREQKLIIKEVII